LRGRGDLTVDECVSRSRSIADGWQSATLSSLRDEEAEEEISVTEWHLGIANSVGSREVMRVSGEAKALGFCGVWISDIRFWRDCYTVLGAVAASTSELRLGSSVSDAYSRHPATLAAIAATLDELAPGRFTLGIGAGGSGMAAIGAERRRPLETVETLICGVRKLLTGQAAVGTSAAFTLAGAELRFRPSKTVGIAMAASGPLMYRLAGRMADTVFLGRYLDPGGIGYLRERIAEGAVRRDPSLGPVEEILRVDVSISDKRPDEAREVIRGRVDGLMRSGYRNQGFLGPIGLGDLVGDDGTLSREQISRIAERVSLSGTPSEVADRVAQVISGASISAMSLSPHLVPGQSLEEAVELTAEVIALVESQA
jgi:5,10-methylenetetrahydromethanopterin reductase